MGNGGEPQQINPALYRTPPDIEGSSSEHLLDALHLFEHRWFVDAVRKILREMGERIVALEGIPRGYEVDEDEVDARLSRDDTIRAQHESGMTYAQIAEEHGISAARVGQIVKGG